MPYNYYAVKKGKTPGIYKSWADCKAQIDGFSGAVYKGFNDINEADAFVSGETVKTSANETVSCVSVDESMPYAFVDGSFNASTGVYGYGGFLIHDGIKEVLTGSGSDAEMASMRNVAGEVCGSMAAIKKALDLGLKEINIYYDYMGIEMWATGEWKRNKEGTINYYDFIQESKKLIKLNFVKVKGHSGIEGNEEADRLAKMAVGIAR